jgi:hypothetical protein
VGACRAAGFRPRIIQEAWVGHPAIVALVGAGLGISLLLSPVPLAPDGVVAYRPLAEDVASWELALACGATTGRRRCSGSWRRREEAQRPQRSCRQ